RTRQVASADGLKDAVVPAPLEGSLWSQPVRGDEAGSAARGVTAPVLRRPRTPSPAPGPQEPVTRRRRRDAPRSVAEACRGCHCSLVPLTAAIIAESIARYRREEDRYVKLAGFVAEQCRRVVEDNAIRATVQWRAKDPTSLELKLRRYMADEQRLNDFDSVED